MTTTLLIFHLLIAYLVIGAIFNVGALLFAFRRYGYTSGDINWLGLAVSLFLWPLQLASILHDAVVWAVNR